MKGLIIAVIMLLLAVSSVSYAGENLTVSETMLDEGNEETMKLHIKIGNETFTANLYDNAAARELIEKLPMTLDMSELNGNEKYFYMESPLTTETEKVGTIHTGDIMLYGADCLVLFYDSFSSPYSYTRLGYIEDTGKLSEALGDGNVSVTFYME